MKKRILASLLSLCLLVGLLPTVALAVETPAGIAAGLGALTAKDRSDTFSTGDVVYFGNIPWYLLDKAYSTGATGDDAVTSGYLFLSQFAYNGGIRWNSYSTDSNPSDGTGYLSSDIRTYLTGTGTYSAFKTVGVYARDNVANNENYTRYWERNAVESGNTLDDGTVYYTKDAENTEYTKVAITEDDWKLGVWYTKGEDDTYTLVTEGSFTSGTDYYREDTPYKPADVSGGFDNNTTYYFFTKPTEKVRNASGREVTSSAGANLARAYYYAGGSIAPVASTNANGGYRVVGGMDAAESGVYFAKDHGISQTELNAIAPVTKDAVDDKSKYAVTTADSGTTYSYHGDGLKGDTFFLLSANEAAPLSIENATNGYWTTQNERIAKYAGTESSAFWWLRSSRYGDTPGCVYATGVLNSDAVTNTRLSVRPAFVLNPESVLFVSAAEGGKTAVVGGFKAIANENTSTWKLTLEDEDLSLGNKTFLADNGEGNYTVCYTDASTYGENVYVSAILTDANGKNIYGYAKLAAVDSDAAKSGSASFTLPEDITLGESYKLQVFLEQANDSTASDYAGDPMELTPKTLSSIAVTQAPTTTTYTAQTAFDPAGMKITATYGEDDSTATRVLADGEYTVSYPTDSYGEDQNDNKFHITQTTATAGSLTAEGEKQNVTITFNGKQATQTVTVKGMEQPIPGSDLAVVKMDSGWKTVYSNTEKALQTSSDDSFSNPADYTEITNTESSPKTVYVRYKAYGDYGPGAVRNITLPAANAEIYKVNIELKLDDETWNGYESGMEYNLIANDQGDMSYYHYDGSDIVVAGTYSIWATNGDNVLADTNVDVTVSNVDATATVNYITATFKSNIPNENDIATPVLSGVEYTAANEKEAMERYAGNHALAFTSFADVTDNKISITSATEYTAQYTVNGADAAGVKCSVTELTNGNPIPTPADAVLNVAGNAQKAAWSIENVTLDTTTATFNTQYIYKATFTAPEGYTFTEAVKTYLGEGWELTDGKLVKTFDAITAGYPINVTGLTDAESVTYKLGSGEMTTYSLPVTEGSVTLSANSASETTLTLKTDKDVTYTGTVTFANNVGSVTLTQQAPVVTMFPSGTSADKAASKNTTEITLTFDQTVTLDTTKAVTLYGFNNAANQNNFTPAATYKMSLTKATLSEDGKKLVLPIANFTSGSTVLALNNGYYYTVMPEDGFVKSQYGDQMSVSFTGKFTCANAMQAISYYVAPPANGSIRGADSNGNVVASGNTTYYLEDGMSVTLNAVPSAGYAFESYTVVVNGTFYTFASAEELAGSDLSWITWNEDGSLTLAPQTTTFTLLADFKVDDTVTYTFTQQSKSVTVSVGSSQTLSYTITPSAAVKLESNDTAVATVSGSNVIGKKEGTATVTAYAPDGVTTISWTIEVVPTQTGTPVVTTGEASGISKNSVTLSASWTGEGFHVMEAGIRIRTVGGASQDFKAAVVPTDGKISVTVNDLTPGATYYYTGYVRTANGTTYTDSIYSSANNAKNFTTTQPSSGGGGGGGGSSSSSQPTVSVGAGGTVKLSGSTLTITPDKGYQIKDVTVNGKSQGAAEKITGLKSSDKVIVTFEKSGNQPSTGFVDVPADAYYADAVTWAVKQGITKGTSETTFSPDTSCTRAQMATFLWRAAGSPAPKRSEMTFTDIPADAYYYDAVLWAVENGITNGVGNNSFAPDAICTRSQMATFLYRFEGTPAVTGSNPFGDVASDAYYAAAVTWAVAEGITVGTGSNLFSPDADCTRGQMVTFLYRYLAN